MPSNKSAQAPWTGKRRPVIGIDPGRPFAYAVHPGPHRQPTGGLLLKGMPWESLLDPWLPAYVFIEQPTGDDTYVREALWRGSIAPILKELGPIDVKTQVVPCTVWRKVVLGHGNATKEDAIAYARQHYKAFRESGSEDHNLAEAFCIMEYGRRVAENRLRDQDDPALTVPLYALEPGGKRRSSRAPRWRLDKEDGGYPPLPVIPWRAIKSADVRLYSVMREWAACYHAVTVHCEERDQRFSARAVREDARVGSNDVDPNLHDIIKHGLAYKDGDVIVFKPARDPADFDKRAFYQWLNGDKETAPAFAPLFVAFLGEKDALSLLQRWAKGSATRLFPADWKRKELRARHDARWGNGQCLGCETFALAPDADYCDLCEERARERAEKEPEPRPNPAHGDDDHENDGNCSHCDDDEAAFLDSPEADQYVSMARDGDDE